jgi:putative sugar O-methyltransferase
MRLLSLLRKRLARRAEISRVIRRGRRRFSGDLRLNVDFVDQGLAPRIADIADDTVLLRRICDAWSKAMEQQSSVSEAFQPHQWWKVMRQTNLGPVTRALAAYDFDSLRRMYRNFFRDRCSAGLSGLPLARIDLGSPVRNSSKQLHLIDALHRVDLWKSRTAGRFALADLKPPDIGNPYGVVVDGIFVRAGSEDQHYCAHRIIDLLGSSEAPVVAEIGGGFGGMAYYLIRDCPSVTYLNFDLPETIALASYYLLSAFPDAKATLYGEAELGAETLRSSRIILMPGFAMPQMPASSVEVAFNSRILSDLSRESLHHYLPEIVRTTRGHLLHLNRTEGSLAADAWFATNAPYFKLVEKRLSEWNNARTLRPNEMEYLYERRSPAQSPSAPDHPPS